MEILNEIKRIKNLMNLSESTNPILGFVLDTVIKDSWAAFKLGKSSAQLTTELDNLTPVAKTQLIKLAEDNGITNAEFLTPVEIANRLVSKNLDDVNSKKFVKLLSQNEEYAKNLAGTLISDEEFKKLIEQSFELGMSASEIKSVLKGYFGESKVGGGITVVDDIYNKLRTSIPASKLGKTALEGNFTLPPGAIESFVNSTEDADIKKAVDFVMGNEAKLKELLNKASEVSLNTPLNKQWFMNEMNEIFLANPTYWTKAKKTEFSKWVAKTWEWMRKHPYKTVSGVGTAALLYYIVAFVGKTISNFSSTKELLDGWRRDCFIEAGYDTQEKFDALKANPQRFEDVFLNLNPCVSQKETNYKKDMGASYIPDSKSATSASNSKNFTMTFDPPQQPPVSTYSDDIDSFKKWMVTRKLKGTPVPSITGVGFDLNGVNYIFDTPSTGFK